MRNITYDNVEKFRKKGKTNKLIKGLQNCEDDNLRTKIAEALGDIGDETAIETLIEMLKDRDFDVTNSAIRALKKNGKQAFEPLLEILKNSEDTKLKENTAYILGTIKNKLAVEPLMKEFKDSDDVDLRCAGAIALGEIGSSDAIDALKSGIQDEDDKVRKAVSIAFGYTNNEEAIESLILLLNDYRHEVRKTAVESLKKQEWRPTNNTQKILWAVASNNMDQMPLVGESVKSLILLLHDEDYIIRANAAVILGEIAGKIGDERALEPLIKLLDDKNETVLTSVATGLVLLADTRALQPLKDLLTNRTGIPDYTRKEISKKIEELEDKTPVKDESRIVGDYFTDKRDNKKYKVKKIGQQIWMAENLNYEIDNSFFYDNDSNNNEFGRLYEWYAARDACPKGWHLPSKKEFEVLIKSLGGEGKNAYKKLIKGGSSGFNALMGGYSSFIKDFYYKDDAASFWTGDYGGHCCFDIYKEVQEAYLSTGCSEGCGKSVRCIKD